MRKARLDGRGSRPWEAPLSYFPPAGPVRGGGRGAGLCRPVLDLGGRSVGWRTVDPVEDLVTCGVDGPPGNLRSEDLPVRLLGGVKAPLFGLQLRGFGDVGWRGGGRLLILVEMRFRDGFPSFPFFCQL